METVSNGECVFARASEVEEGEERGRAAERRLGEIRRLSNLVQALENVAVQCGGDDWQAEVRGFIDQCLVLAREELRKLIHRIG